MGAALHAAVGGLLDHPVRKRQSEAGPGEAAAKWEGSAPQKTHKPKEGDEISIGPATEEVQKSDCHRGGQPGGSPMELGPEDCGLLPWEHYKITHPAWGLG